MDNIMHENKGVFQWKEHFITEILALHAENCYKTKLSVEIFSQGSRLGIEAWPQTMRS